METTKIVKFDSGSLSTSIGVTVRSVAWVTDQTEALLEVLPLELLDLDHAPRHLVGLFQYDGLESWRLPNSLAAPDVQVCLEGVSWSVVQLTL